MTSHAGAGVTVEQELVTVVIPAFNAEETLSRTMESVLIQSHSCLEVIVVDDGSTDRTPLLAKDYASRDPRVHVIQQENLGLSEARNTGIRAAKGAWIAFLDADDWVEKDYLEIPLRLAKETGTLVVFFGYVVDFEETPGVISHSIAKLPGGGNRLLAEESAELGRTDFLGMLGYAWNKLYRLPEDRQEFLFEPGLKLVEDMEFQSRVLPEAEKIMLCPTALVHYVQPQDKMTLGRTYSPRNFELRLRWLACARSLVSRWGLMNSSARASFATLGLMIVYEAQRQAWSSTRPWSRRLASVARPLRHPETATLGWRAVTTREVPLLHRMIGAALWLTVACRISMRSKAKSGLQASVVGHNHG